MYKFVFFTKTNWNEPPRLRHQLAYLLLKNNNEVLFLEKPRSFTKLQSSKVSITKTNLKLYRSSELIHHKLRVIPFLNILNSVYESYLLKKFFKDYVHTNFVIVNFNYDYYFLRKLFPENKIITIINDDFTCRGFYWFSNYILNNLKKTCQISDHVFTVSYPLIKQLKGFCRPSLLLPWSEYNYSFKSTKINRYILLFWGFINSRLNFEYIFKLSQYIQKISSQLELHFIGPIEQGVEHNYKHIFARKNIILKESLSFEELSFDNVLCSFIPYITGNKADDATTIPNKAFPMLSAGLPLVITGMPFFINKSFVFRLTEDVVKDVHLLNHINENFQCLQKQIELYVNANKSCIRYEQFMNVTKINL